MRLEVGRVCDVIQDLSIVSIFGKTFIKERAPVIVLPSFDYSNTEDIKRHHNIPVGIFSNEYELEKQNGVGDVSKIYIKYLKPTNRLIKTYDIFDEKVLIEIGRNLGVVHKESGWFIEKFGRKEYIKRLQLLQSHLHKKVEMYKLRKKNTPI